MNEFSLIEQFFQPLSINHPNTVFGIGDDAACIEIPSGRQLVISTDTLVSGVHFLPEWDPFQIAQRAVAVTVSDMAAMAADATSITLALTLPEFNSSWLNSFTRGLKESLNAYQIDLIGGDTTRGPLAITVTAMGTVPAGQAIRRNGAKVGDVIFVSGILGGAALAVEDLKTSKLSEAHRLSLMQYLLHPKARLDLKDILRKYASAAIDISDGLSADLNHICTASGVGACLTQETIPVHHLLNKYLGDSALDLALCGGDDYELCFTVPAAKLPLLQGDLNKANLVCYSVGIIEESLGLRMKTIDDTYQVLRPQGYSHFS